MSLPECTMHLIANTHWDREWRFTVEQTRPLLRDKMGEILHTLESQPDFSSFLLDGQSVILDDYLLVCPDERERVARLMREGRLFAGPWYSLPDEFIVSGESIVRNILIGHQTCAEFGGAMKVAYTPCSYGQISQMPQIWRGFGIDAALFYRGVRNDLTERLFRWEGADGSQIVVYRFGPTGRTDFFWEVLRPAVYDKGRDRTVVWGKDGVMFHLCGPGDFRDDYYILERPVQLIADERLKQGIDRLKETHFLDSPLRDHLLLMAGSDCTAPHPRTADLVREVNRQIEPRGDRLLISSIPAFFDAVKQRLRIEDLRTSLKGELHEAVKVSGSSLLESVIAMRIYLKQANEATEVALQNWAEPAAAIAWGLGRRYPRRFLRRAWKTLLACHPHDSICGVSVDAVCDDMIDRFREARECAEGVAREGLQTIVQHIDLSGAPADGVFVTVFNPLPWPQSRVVRAVIDMPMKGGRIDSLLLTGPDGERAEAQHLSVREDEAVVQHPDDMISLLAARRFEVAFEASAIPAMGYRTYRVEGRRGGFASASSLQCGPAAMENEIVKVEIAPNGTVTLTDKEGGRVYPGLNAFEDTGDIGIGWNAIQPQKDRVVLSHGAKAEIALVESGPLLSAFEIRQTLMVPAERSSDGVGRSSVEVPIGLVSRVTLRKGSRAVEFETTIDNRAKHHRLRALFPTGLKTDRVHAGGQFNVLERPIRKEDTSNWSERKHPTDPFHTFAGLSDGQRGLAIVAQGLREYEAIDDASRTLAVTIHRSVKCQTYLCAPEHEEMDGAQCLGRNTVRYAVIAHRGRWDEAELYRDALAFTIGVKAAQHSRTNGTAPREAGFFSVDSGNIVMSAFKKAEERDSFIVRLYNPTARVIVATLTCRFSLARVDSVNLAEEPQGEIPVTDGHCAALEIGSKKIVTLELIPKKG